MIISFSATASHALSAALATSIFSVALPAGIPAKLWLPYFSGAVVLILGIARVAGEMKQQPLLQKLILLGPTLFAFPLAVFGTEHFTEMAFIKALMPAWIPFHLFWVILVGICLIAASLAIVLRKKAALAAGLVALTMLGFALMLHIPDAVSALRDRFLWAIALRTLAFCGGGLAIASQAESWDIKLRDAVLASARILIGVPVVLFAVEHFLHPDYVPVIPLNRLMPAWVPAHLLVSYVTGLILLVTGLCLLANRYAGTAATTLGAAVFLIVLVIYVPMMLMNPGDISGLNYVADTLFLAGGPLAYAATQPHRQAVRSQVQMGAVKAA